MGSSLSQPIGLFPVSLPSTGTVNIPASATWSATAAADISLGQIRFFLVQDNPKAAEPSSEIQTKITKGQTEGIIPFTATQPGTFHLEAGFLVTAFTLGNQITIMQTSTSIAPQRTQTSISSTYSSSTHSDDRTLVEQPPATTVTPLTYSSSTHSEITTTQPTSVPTTPLTTSTTPMRNISLIVGVISGIVIFIMLATAGLLLNHRRKRRLLRLMEPPPVSPYPDTTSAMNVPGEKKRRLIGEDHENDRVLDTSPVQEHQPGDEPSDNILILEDGQHRTQEPLQQERERRVRHHKDSGWRPAPPLSDAGESSILDVPPQYDAAV